MKQLPFSFGTTVVVLILSIFFGCSNAGAAGCFACGKIGLWVTWEDVTKTIVNNASLTN